MSESKDRILYLSRIRVLASMAIVVLHTFTMYGIVEKDVMTDTETYVTRVVPYLMMWAVPCFVMVSGVLLLDKKRNIPVSRLLTRYVLRMLVVLLLFTTLFFFLDLWMNKEAFTAEGISTILHKFAEDKSWAHLWYLYLLIGMYLLLPAYRAVAQNVSRGTMIYICIIYVIFLSVLPAVTKMTDQELGFYICSSSIFPMYLFLGDLMHRKELKVGWVAGAVLLAGGAVLIILLTGLDFGERQGEMDSLLGNYSFLPVILLSVGAFALIRGREGKGGEKSRMVWQFLDKHSFAVYLTHLIFLRFLIKVVKWNPLETGSFWMLIPVAVLTYIVALLIAVILKLIPGLKKLL